MVVVSLKFGLPATSVTKHRGKEIGKSTLVTVRKVFSATIVGGALFGKRVTPGIGLLLPSVLKLFGVLPVLAVLIVLFPFLGIAQLYVCFIDLLENFWDLRIVGIQIGMMFARQLTVGFLYFLSCRVFINT